MNRGGEMATVIVRYKVKTDKADENIAYIEAVFAALQEASPEGIRYLSMVADDGVSFTHIAMIESDDSSNPLPELPEFQAFIADIGARCEEPPVPVGHRLIGSYRAFG